MSPHYRQIRRQFRRSGGWVGLALAFVYLGVDPPALAQADFAANFSFQETPPASRIPINCHRLSGAKKFTPGKGIFSMTM